MEVTLETKVQHNLKANLADLAVALVVDHHQEQVEQEIHLQLVLLKEIMVEMEVNVIKL